MYSILVTIAGGRVAAHIPVDLSANDRFKRDYPRYLRWALLVALLLTALGVWLMPRYEPVPYKPRAEVFYHVKIPDAPEVVDKIVPRVVPHIPPVIEAAPNEDPHALDTIIENTLIDVPIAPVVPIEPVDDFDFVPSSAKPLLRFQPKADYPEIARRAGLEGTVVVSVLVDMDGTVDEVAVIEGVHPLLDRAAAAAAGRCLFEPARQRELRVKAWVAVPYRFRLR